LEISVVAKHIPREHEIRQAAKERLEELEKFYRGRIESAHVVVDVHRDYAEAEIRVHTGDGGVFVTHKTGKDVEVALETAYSHIKRQLMKQKEIKRRRRRDKGVKEEGERGSDKGKAFFGIKEESYEQGEEEGEEATGKTDEEV